MKKLMIKTNIPSFFNSVGAILFGAFIIRIILANFGTLSLDQNTFIAWGRAIALNGFSTFYNGWSDYLPGYLFVLSILARLEVVWPLSITILYKLPAILGDLGVAYLLYRFVEEHKGHRIAVLCMGLFLLNPAIIVNSTLWGQVDILTAFFAILSVWLLTRQRPWASALSLAVGALMKPQAALAAPVILWILIQKKYSLKQTTTYISISLLTFLAAFIPFTSILSLPSFAVERLNVTLTQYPYGSVNAFNFWGLWGFWQMEKPGLFSIKNIGFVLFSFSSIVSFLRVKSEKIASHYLLLGMLFFANFLFFTHMHERHLLPAIVALSFATPFLPVLLVPMIGVSVVYILNMYYSYIWITESFKNIFSHEAIVFFIVVNLLSFVLIFMHDSMKRFMLKIKKQVTSRSIVRNAMAFLLEFVTQKKDANLPTTISNTRTRLLLFVILLFALVTRLIGLSSPKQEYFDEVYHAFTARAMLHDDVRAWEWWNENPQGFAFEWTHPPLAKEAMVIGMRIFGESAFGWRIPAALTGTIVVFLVFKIASELFNKEVGLLSAGAMSLDGLPVVMSRIGMNDIYLVCFLLATFYLFLKNRYFASSVTLGLSAASKWTTLWLLPILLFTGAFAQRKLKKSMIWFVIIPPLIYLLSYLPQFISGHPWDIFWGMQKQMWWYHTQLVATHPYTSRWWSWPLLLRPIWLYTSGEQNGMVSNIYGMGNPIVFWTGLIAVITSLYYGFVEKRKNILIVVIAYAALFMPWALSPRIMFFYHYFPAVPFMCIAIGFVLYKNKAFIAPFFVLAMILFMYFYPHWTGLSIPVWLDSSYYWLPGWK